MSQITEMLDSVKNTDKYTEHANLLSYVGNIVLKTNGLSRSDLEYIVRFSVDEMRRLLTVIPTVTTYKKKDEIFNYEDKLLMLYTLAGKKADCATDADIEVIQELVTLVSAECTIETAVDKLFKQNAISKADIDKVIEIVKPITDEYRRGKFLQGLNEYKDGIKKLSPEAQAALAEYLADEAERLIPIARPDSDEMVELEYLADVCKHCITDRLLDLLERAVQSCADNVRYYALETLLANNRAVTESIVKPLAEDLEYAELTYGLLCKHGKQALFPAELNNTEYLAKSDMVHWLVYPTELGKKPDDVQLLGSGKVKKEVYYVFKYKSDSDNLCDECVNQWLIGWSSPDGGTFSNFDLLRDYEKKTVEKTVKHIIKKLIK
ncbi:MAG: hypothetical protein K2I75_01315 [Clostridiales bacterium]|nr:hypothetical protein [Clostridiales bacterium]